MNIWLTGGAGSGKSALAQKLAVQLSQDNKRYYLATMIPRDDEDEARIRRHQKDREGLGFETLLCTERLDLQYMLKIKNLEDRRSAHTSTHISTHTSPHTNINEDEISAGTFLLDSVTALLSNRMFGTTDFRYNPHAAEEILQEISELSLSAGNLLVVSDGIYSDGRRYDEMTEHFRRGLAMIERSCAERFDKVILCEAGNARAVGK